MRSAQFFESVDDFTITGDHLPGFTNQDVTQLHTSPEYPSHLRLIPSAIFNIFPNLRSINLSGSQIETISGLQSCLLLDRIILTSNIIQSIQSAAFSSCPSLIEIDVSINQINEVHANAFSGLNSLTQVHLNNNTISTLSPGTFNVVPTIELIQLHTNNFEQIPANVFHNLPSLSILNLNSNRIPRIQANAFNNLPNLGTIRLDQNFITDIDADAFAFTGLYQIYLRNNLIAQISSQTFGTTTSQLRGIFIESNRIIAIEPRFFQIGLRIEVLNMINNLCASISFDPTFANIPVLLELCFRNWEDGTDITTTSSTTAAPTTTTPSTPGSGLKILPNIEIIFVLLMFCIIRLK